MDEIIMAIERVISSANKKVNSDYLDSYETAKFLGISRSTLFKKNHARVIPFFKPTGSKHVFYDRRDLEKYITQNRLKSKEEIALEATKKGGRNV